MPYNLIDLFWANVHHSCPWRAELGVSLCNLRAQQVSRVQSRHLKKSMTEGLSVSQFWLLLYAIYEDYLIIFTSYSEYFQMENSLII